MFLPSPRASRHAARESGQRVKTQYIICDQFGSVRIEPAVYGDFEYVQTYADAEAAGRAAEMLNEEFSGLTTWTVWEMKPWQQS